MTPLTLKRANKWRAVLNPLRGFQIQRAVSLLEDGERGAYADLQWAYRFAEKRNATLRGLKRLRLAAISKLDWDIKIVDPLPEGATEQQAQKQQRRLREAYDRIENLKRAIRWLALAEFRGFAHLEKRYEQDKPSKPVVRLDPVEQWFWCRDTYLGAWEYNPEARNTTKGEPVDLQHFIMREVDDPINEIGLLVLAMEGLAKKDWAGFVEVFGISPIFGELPPDVSDDGKVAEYQRMMEAVIGDMRGTIPHGAKIHTVGDGVRGVHPFRDFLEFLKEELVLAGTSGKLTMLNGPTGLGGGQSEVHQDTFDELAQAEAAEISELFQQHFDKPILDTEFTGQPALAYFEIAAKDQADVGQVLDHAVKANQAGVRIDTGELSEKTGYTLVDAPEPSFSGGFGTPAFPGGPDARSGPTVFNRIARWFGFGKSDVSATRSRNRESAKAAVDKLVAAKRATFAPLLTHLDAIQRAADPGEFADAVEALRAEIKRRGPEIMRDPQMAQVLETILGEAAAEGAVEVLQKGQRS